MNFLDVIVQARRFLRDPDAAIWDSDMLNLYWDEASTEIAQKINLLSRARTLRYPSQSSITYMYDWEYQYTMATRIPTVQIFKTFQEYEDGVIVLYPWEVVYDASTSNTIDNGYRITQGWEAYYGTPAEPPRVILNDRFEKIRYAAMDEKTITHQDERTIMRGDAYYKSSQGEAINYYFPDTYHNELVVYPIPTITLDDDKIYPSTGLLDKNISLYNGYGFTYLWETLYKTVVKHILLESGDFLLMIDGSKLIGETYNDQIKDNYDITHLYSSGTTRYNYLFDWEYDTLCDNPPTAETEIYKIMRYFEYPTTTKEIPGWITGTSDEIITGVDDELYTDGNLFLIYDYIPKPLEDFSHDLEDWPGFMVKTVMSGMLERAYSADTDGFIPSLRDYWKMRKEVGIRSIKLFKLHRSRDRDYTLGGNEQEYGKAYPKLPAHYPATYP